MHREKTTILANKVERQTRHPSEVKDEVATARPKLAIFLSLI